MFRLQTWFQQLWWRQRGQEGSYQSYSQGKMINFISRGQMSLDDEVMDIYQYWCHYKHKSEGECFLAFGAKCLQPTSSKGKITLCHWPQYTVTPEDGPLISLKNHGINPFSQQCRSLLVLLPQCNHQMSIGMSIIMLKWHKSIQKEYKEHPSQAPSNDIWRHRCYTTIIQNLSLSL